MAHKSTINELASQSFIQGFSCVFCDKVTAWGKYSQRLIFKALDMEIYAIEVLMCGILVKIIVGMYWCFKTHFSFISLSVSSIGEFLTSPY